LRGGGGNGGERLYVNRFGEGLNRTRNKPKSEKKKVKLTKEGGEERVWGESQIFGVSYGFYLSRVGRGKLRKGGPLRSEGEAVMNKRRTEKDDAEEKGPRIRWGKKSAPPY